MTVGIIIGSILALAFIILVILLIRRMNANKSLLEDDEYSDDDARWGKDTAWAKTLYAR